MLGLKGGTLSVSIAAHTSVVGSQLLTGRTDTEEQKETFRKNLAAYDSYIKTIESDLGGRFPMVSPYHAVITRP